MAYSKFHEGHLDFKGKENNLKVRKSDFAKVEGDVGTLILLFAIA
jgi:hypothetical protein